MICKKCQIAGDMVAEARTLPNLDAPIYSITKDTLPVPTKEAVRSVAHMFHGLCKGHGHCDCQHKVDFEGKSIQRSQ